MVSFSKKTKNIVTIPYHLFNLLYNIKNVKSNKTQKKLKKIKKVLNLYKKYDIIQNEVRRMIQIYTTPSCASCRKAKKWFDQYNIPYSEKNIFSIKLSKEDIFRMLANSENGFEDIISTRSKIFREKKLEPEQMSVQALVSFIIEYPSVLKRPIIINENELQVGYNNEDITIFLPKELRNSEIFNSFSKGLDEDEEAEDEDE